MKRSNAIVLAAIALLTVPVSSAEARPGDQCHGQWVFEPEPYEHIADENQDGYVCRNPKNGRLRDNLIFFTPT